MRRDVFQAIADPTRREIIHLLSREKLTLNGVADNFKISRPAVSKHIKILNECGLVVITKQGRERFCYAVPGNLKEVDSWIKQFRDFWEMKLDALDNYLNKANKKLLNKKSKKEKR